MTPLVAAAVIVMAPGAHHVTINNLSIAYHVHGKGPVVIAHAGGPGAQWDILRMPEVEKFATVVYLEPVGTGASGRLDDPNGYTIERYVKDVEGLRAVLGLDRFVLLGHSHGGFVAQAYALAYPNRLRGLILYDTSPTTGPVWQRDVEANLAWFEREPWFAEAKLALAQETTAKDDDEMTAVFRREMPLYFADWTAHAARYEPYRAAVRFAVAPGRAGTDPQAPGQVGIAPVFDVVSRLGEIRVPTLILSGTKDFVCSARFGRVLHEGIPESRLVLLPHSGHMGHIEEPLAFAAAVQEYLVEIARPRTP
ncbi:MAG TPA: alpha/beta fold hydrolase [Actinomycetota bacterium]|nr:alpha/beta fold hydrolase [Actinomycetota bacterium]